jgi:hypothetical protein
MLENAIYPGQVYQTTDDYGALPGILIRVEEHIPYTSLYRVAAIGMGNEGRVTIHRKYITKVKVKEKNMKGYEKVDPFIKPKAKKIDKWSFTVGSLHQIEEEKIHDCLSYKNPLALVTINDKMFVALHDSIPNKMGLCEGGWELMQELTMLLTDMPYPGLYPIEDMKVVGQLQKFIKRVKSRPYLEDIREAGTVTVQVINI